MNRTMVAKHSKAKKYAIKEIKEMENMKSCASPRSKTVQWTIKHKPYISY